MASGFNGAVRCGAVRGGGCRVAIWRWVPAKKEKTGLMLFVGSVGLTGPRKAKCVTALSTALFLGGSA